MLAYRKGCCRRSCRQRGRIHDRTDLDGRRRPDPMTSSPGQQPGNVVYASIEATDRFCRDVFAAIGADEATADAATRAMMHGSRHGVDSHGVRLLDHYVKVMNGGRVNRQPNVRVVQSFGAVASLDTDNGHGALGAYRGMDHAIELAEKFGIGAVSIRNGSHFGPAGAYAM